jgi:hypothetical protein
LEEIAKILAINRTTVAKRLWPLVLHIMVQTRIAVTEITKTSLKKSRKQKKGEFAGDVPKSF